MGYFIYCYPDSQIKINKLPKRTMLVVILARTKVTNHPIMFDILIIHTRTRMFDLIYQFSMIKKFRYDNSRVFKFYK